MILSALFWLRCTYIEYIEGSVVLIILSAVFTILCRASVVCGVRSGCRGGGCFLKSTIISLILSVLRIRSFVSPSPMMLYTTDVYPDSSPSLMCPRMVVSSAYFMMMVFSWL